MVDRLTCAKNQVRLLTKINQELDEELHKSIQKNTAQGIMISTHEVTIGQQDIRIKKLEAQVKELQGWDFENIIDKIYGEQNLKSPKDIRIEELEAQLRELQDWDSADMPNGERVYNTGRGMIQYPFNPEGEEPYCMQCSGDEGYLDECICEVENAPTIAYPYTHPIREVPPYGRVKVK